MSIRVDKRDILIKLCSRPGSSYRTIGRNTEGRYVQEKNYKLLWVTAVEHLAGLEGPEIM